MFTLPKLNQEQVYYVIVVHHYEMGCVYVPLLTVFGVTLLYLQADHRFDAHVYGERFPEYIAALQAGDLYAFRSNTVIGRGMLTFRWRKESFHGFRFTLTLHEIMHVAPSSKMKETYAMLTGLFVPH